MEENAHNFYKRYLSREISIRKAGWAELKTECQGMDWKELEHLFKDDFYFVAFVGHKEQVEDQANEIQKVILLIVGSPLSRLLLSPMKCHFYS